MPQSFRFGLVEEGELEFTIALGLGGCLAIYRKSDIQKIIDKFRSKQHIAKYQKFFTLFFSMLYPTSCDSVGRVLLPPMLKKAVGIDTEIVIAGVLDKIELWPKDRYESNLGLTFGSKESQETLSTLIEDAFALLSDEEGEHESEA
ncbi:Transcriptional regulator MraZ [Rhabdochlamydiaceae symbiont of Dictyostelium giganteum]